MRRILTEQVCYSLSFQILYCGTISIQVTRQYLRRGTRDKHWDEETLDKRDFQSHPDKHKYERIAQEFFEWLKKLLSIEKFMQWSLNEADRWIDRIKMCIAIFPFRFRPITKVFSFLIDKRRVLKRLSDDEQRPMKEREIAFKIIVLQSLCSFFVESCCLFSATNRETNNLAKEYRFSV